jgi:hypothetical protein
MQIRALYDQKGRILAAIELKATKAGSEASPVPQPQPLAGRGQRVGDFTVPPECKHLSFAEVCSQLVISTIGKHSVLTPNSSPRRRKGTAGR